MYISELVIEGYRAFGQESAVKLNRGLTVLVGENGCGKSSVIDALRLLLLEDEYGRSGVSPSDFHRPIDQPASYKGADRIAVRCLFDELTEKESVAFLPWLDVLEPDKASLSLVIENKQNDRGRFKRTIWGGASSSAAFEWPLLDAVDCIYLPPLRDAEDKLGAYKGSRLARVLKNLKGDQQPGSPHPLEKKATAFNDELLKEDAIKKANDGIRKYLRESLGAVMGQDALIQFSEVSFDRIVERLRLLFYPKVPGPGTEHKRNLFRELRENSLGYNNLLYLATVLAELEGIEGSETLHKVLLIEEPEAHLHPQLQVRLLQYLEKIAESDRMQVIVTTHSPTIASSVKLNAVIVLVAQDYATPISVPLALCQMADQTKFFLERWLDITKSTLLFARGVVMVEGIAEGLVIPELARIVISQDEKRRVQGGCLKDFGVSVISLGGNFFQHFVELFRADENKLVRIPVKSSCLLDNDPEKELAPTPHDPAASKNPNSALVQKLQSDAYCRAFINFKTFEYDLALEGNNLQRMSRVFLSLVTTDGEIKRHASECASKDWSTVGESDKATEALWLLKHIDGEGKGEYAQALAYDLHLNVDGFAIPQYIKDAILWVL
jgi:putative ATP-dependent endonuclease of the OLD family